MDDRRLDDALKVMTEGGMLSCVDELFVAGAFQLSPHFRCGPFLNVCLP